MSGGIVELRVLGSTALSGDSVRRVEELLRHPKRLALLTYLIVARPRGFQRRERLLSLFWPGQPDARARHALRQTLHELRGDVGAVIATRGADEIGVSQERLWCDAVAFDDAIAEGNLETAVSLFRGDLLDGLVIHGASPVLQDWLDRERARYREEAARAACDLAERAATRADAGAAARWARLSATLAPLDELVLCRGLEIYHLLGYRANAEQLYRFFAQRLHTEFGLEPSERTRSLMNSIRGASS